jgi:hypothetical protein
MNPVLKNSLSISLPQTVYDTENHGKQDNRLIT